MKFKKDDKPIEMNATWERMLELIDLTREDKRWWDWKLQELCRLRELICGYFYWDNQYKTTKEFLDKYFMFFALIVRYDDCEK